MSTVYGAGGVDGVAESLLEWSIQGALDNISPGTGNFTVPIGSMITGYSTTLVELDSNSWRSGNVLTVPVGKAGWYLVSFAVDHPTDAIGGSTQEALADYNVGIKINSRVEKYSADSNTGMPEVGNCSIPVYLNVGDTIEFIINADAAQTGEDFLVRASILSLNTQIFGAEAGSYLRKDGSESLTADWDIGDTRKILADEIRARDAAGLYLLDDAGAGIFVEDGGKIGLGTNTPATQLEVVGALTLSSAASNADINLNSLARPTINPLGGNTPANLALQIRSKGTGDLELNADNNGNVIIAMGGGNVGIGVAGPLTTLHLPLENTPTAPTISFGAGNTGVYQPASGVLGFSADGANKVNITSAMLELLVDIIPNADNTYDLGDSTPLMWKDLYLRGGIITTTATFTINDGVRDRLNIGASFCSLVSPDGSNYVSVQDATVVVPKPLVPSSDSGTSLGNSTTRWSSLYLLGNIYYGTESRVNLAAANSQFRSPDGNKAFHVDNAGCKIYGSLVPSGADDLGGASDKWADLYMNGDINAGASFNIHDGTRNRLLIAAGNASLYSPNGNIYFNVSNSYARIYGVYNNTIGSAANIYMDGSSVLYRSTSSRKIKKDILENVNPDWTLQFKPITFREKANDIKRIGFVAEDMREIDPRFATDGGKEDLPGLETNAILAAITATVQRQQTQIQELYGRL